MAWRSFLRHILFGLLTFLGAPHSGFAQNTSLEFWPETDIWYRLGPAWRLSAFIPITKYHESQERDLNVYLQADFSWGRTKRLVYRRLMDDNMAKNMKGWMARAGFMEGWSLGDNAEGYTEDMLFAEIHKRTPLKGGVLVSHRLRTDFRWVGHDPDFSYRLRYRFMAEKEFKAGRSSIVPYLNAEPYWDSRFSYFNRLRLAGGATVTWGKLFAFEGNLTYQYDEQYSTANIFALNLILHLYF